MRAEIDRPRWYRIVVSSIGIAVALWNAYVSLHDHGVVAGRVVDVSGKPVEGATVVLWVLNFTTYVEKARGTTSADGGFVIRGNDPHNVQIEAEKSGMGRSPRVPVRLYFKAEDVSLPTPLVLAGGG